MQEVLSEIGVWAARGDRIALATVIDVQRSAPRPPGAKMAVNEHGEIAGSVSGGCVEGAVAEIADGILRGDPPQLLHFGIADSDAWDVGLPCGGEIDVWVQSYEPGRFEELARGGGRAAEVTMMEGASPGAKLLVEADGRRSGSLGSPELDDEAARVAVELLWAESRLWQARQLEEAVVAGRRALYGDAHPDTFANAFAVAIESARRRKESALL